MFVWTNLKLFHRNLSKVFCLFVKDIDNLELYLSKDGNKGMYLNYHFKIKPFTLLLLQVQTFEEGKGRESKLQL